MERPTDLAWIALLAAACARDGGAAASGTPATARRAILIVCDTLRADRLGSLGSDSGATPGLDRFAREAVVFEEAYASASMTLPSMSSVLTGWYPRDVGAVPGNTSMMSAEVETLPERLRDEGITTAAVVSNWVLRSWEEILGDRSVWQGFEHYDDVMDEVEPNRAGSYERSARATTAAAAAWLRAAADRGEDRFFLWVHYQDPHGPYTPPPDLARRFEGPVRDDVRLPIGRRNSGHRQIPHYQELPGEDRVDVYRHRYEAEVAAFDAGVAALLEELRALGWYEDSAIVLTADHGESLGEHDYWFSHGEHVHREVVHVPLFLRLPGGRRPDWVAGGRTRRVAGHVDLRPTIEAALGLEPSPGRGASLLEPPPEDRVLVQRVFPDDVDDGWLAMSDGTHRLVWQTGSKERRLFDVRADPGETRDLSDERPDVVADLLARGRAHLEATDPGGALDGTALPLDDASRDALRQLGYVDPAED